MDIQCKINQGFDSLKTADEAGIINIARQLFFMADRGGSAGFIAYLKGVLTREFPAETRDLLDANTLVLIQKHKMQFAYAAAKLPGDLKQKMLDYTKQLKAGVDKDRGN